MPPFRIEPALSSSAYRTFRLSAPLRTHWRPATCADVGCPMYAHGWVTVVDEATDLGRRQADYIRRESGRRYREDRDDAGLTRFTFEAGQECFAARQHEFDPSGGRHVVRTGRPVFTVEHDGDWRARRNIRRVSPSQWVDDFTANQDRLQRLREWE